MIGLKGFASVVFPTKNLEASVSVWSAVLGRRPTYQGEDFAGFRAGGVDVGLSAAPWVDHPLVFWKVDDIAQAHQHLVGQGATPMAEIWGGSLAELGTAEVTNGDPATGIVTVPGGKLAVLKLTDGNLVALHQETLAQKQT